MAILLQNAEAAIDCDDVEAQQIEFIECLGPGAENPNFNTQSLSELGSQIINALFIAGLFVAVASLIIVAIRIMFARATGDVDGAKASSNGIGWILASVVLILIAPVLVAEVWRAFGGV